MVCHSHTFVDEVLGEKLGGNAISEYLRKQLYSLGCDDFSRVCRALDQAHGSGRFTAVQRGPFNGTLKGYGHVHYLHEKWLTANFAHVTRLPINLSVDELADATAQQILDGRISLRESISKLSERMASKATGHWLIYREDPQGKRLYLAIHPHVTPGSTDELQLLSLLKQIEACCYDDERLHD